MKSHIPILLMAAFVFGSCNSNSTSTSLNGNNNGGGGGTPANTMILTVGGVVDTFTTQSITSDTPTVTILDTCKGITVEFNLVNVSSPGHYDIGTIFSASSSGVVMNYVTTNPSTSYTSATTSGIPNGIMAVTQVSFDSVQGTFNDTLYLLSGNANSPRTIVVTNGSINATFL